MLTASSISTISAGVGALAYSWGKGRADHGHGLAMWLSCVHGLGGAMTSLRGHLDSGRASLQTNSKEALRRQRLRDHNCAQL